MNRQELEDKKLVELRAMCIQKEIVGMSKKRKDVVIDALLADDDGDVSVADDPSNVNGIDGSFTSILSKPDADFGNKTTTTISVSAGASSGLFPVVGKTVGAVSEFLREVLNVDKMSQGIVDGKPVDGDYVLQSGDSLEFLKPAGRKG